MLKFVICDDLTTEANTLKNHIERYAREKSLRVEIDAYSEAQTILAVLARIAEYDLVFLNIYMERLNGIDLARWLREQGDNSRIIFFSTSKEHALDTFGVNDCDDLITYAWHYLGGSGQIVEYARKREARGLISVTNLARLEKPDTP